MVLRKNLDVFPNKKGLTQASSIDRRGQHSRCSPSTPQKNCKERKPKYYGKSDNRRDPVSNGARIPVLDKRLVADRRDRCHEQVYGGGKNSRNEHMIPRKDVSGAPPRFLASTSSHGSFDNDNKLLNLHSTASDSQQLRGKGKMVATCACGPPESQRDVANELISENDCLTTYNILNSRQMHNEHEKFRLVEEHEKFKQKELWGMQRNESIRSNAIVVCAILFAIVTLMLMHLYEEAE